MILGIDVHYEEHAVRAAGVGFAAWEADAAALEIVVRREEAPAPYEPGEFYRRELPHLMAIVEEVRRRRAVEVVIVDGHVWLEEGRAGLGAHLARAMGGGVVVGVAKHVRAMHGPFRMPTLLKRVDGLARGHELPDPANG